MSLFFQSYDVVWFYNNIQMSEVEAISFDEVECGKKVSE